MGITELLAEEKCWVGMREDYVSSREDSEK